MCHELCCGALSSHSLLPVSPRVTVEATCNKKKKQFHSSQIKTSAKNFSRTFMPKKGGSCSASSFKSWQASRLGDNGVFGGLLIVWQTRLQSPSPSGSSKPRSRFQALFPCCQVPAVHSLSSTLTDTSLCERT